MRVSARGQVTIPKKLRQEAGFLPGCEVEFVLGFRGRVYLQKIVHKSRGHDLIEHLRGRGSVQMSAQTILHLTRGRKLS
jgi:bifunctional DNA-binding transcriptional regulator/antitoxin component of YhaV-PrlF toxin-antitoxin module